MVDANQRWGVDEAIDWMIPLAKYNLKWIEEPTSPDDILGHAKISTVCVSTFYRSKTVEYLSVRPSLSPMDRQQQRWLMGLLLRSGLGNGYRSTSAAATRHARRVNFGPTVSRSNILVMCLLLADRMHLLPCLSVNNTRVCVQALHPYGIGVATGEHCQNRVMFKQLLQSRALQYCQIDSCRLAGPNEILAVYLMAAKFNG